MPQDIYDKIMVLAKRRGFLYPSFEIYGGVAGFFDYGPLGAQLKQNVEDLWRSYFLLQDSCFEINTPTITLFEVLKASGHVDEFTDLTVDCPQCETSFKVEDIIDDTMTVEDAVEKDDMHCPTCGTKLVNPHPVNLMFATQIGIGKTRDAFLRPETAQGIFTGFHLLYRYAREKLPFGVCQLGKGYRNEVSPRQGPLRMREFSMAEAEVFFDPLNKKHERFGFVKENELFLFDNVKEMKLSLKDAVGTGVINNQALAYYMYLTQSFLLDAGIDPKKCRFRKHADDEMAHYAQECWDVELFSERFGWVECVGIADRSAYDLSAHIKSSKTDMYALRRYDEPKLIKQKKVIVKMNALGPLYKQDAGKIKDALETYVVSDESGDISVDIDGKTIVVSPQCYEIKEVEEKEIGEKFVPHVIEPSFGIDRILYMLLEHSYKEGVKNDEEYHLLGFNPGIAPIKTGVFPLIGDKKLVDLAKKIDFDLRIHGINTYYDDGGTIGRRYARMDEIGTPFCVTVDHDSLSDNKVTVRDRDTTEQKRVLISELSVYLKDLAHKKG
jgi:glycyl-tRNA synthetase